MATAVIPESLPPKPPHPLRNSNFRLWWIGQTISMVGDQFYIVALPWLILQRTGSAVAMGTVMMAAAIPRAVLMLIGGAVTDRVSARKVMMSTASARTLLVAAVGLLEWMHVLQLWHLYLLAFAFGVADAFAGPAAQAFLPSLVQRDQMVATFSVVQSTVQLTSIAAPAPVGWIIKALGIAWAFFIDAISFLFIIGALWRLPDPPVTPSPGARPAMWRSIAEGIGLVGKDVPLRSLIWLASVMNFCIAGPMTVGLAYLVKTRFGSPSAYGIVVAALAGGGLLGSLLAGVLKVRRRGLLILSAGFALAVCIGSIGLLSRFWVLAGVLLLMGATAGVTNVHIGAWIQQRLKPETRGRVSSVLSLGTLGLLPVSLAVAGVLVAWNLQLMFILAGVALVTVVAAAALQETVRQIE